MGHFSPPKTKKKYKSYGDLNIQTSNTKVVEIQSPDPTIRSPDVGAELTIIFNVNKPL